jgi:hypothetical protein
MRLIIWLVSPVPLLHLFVQVYNFPEQINHVSDSKFGNGIRIPARGINDLDAVFFSFCLVNVARSYAKL